MDPLPPYSKPPLHPTMYSIDDSLKDITSFLSSTTLRYSDSPSSSHSTLLDDITDLPYPSSYLSSYPPPPSSSISSSLSSSPFSPLRNTWSPSSHTSSLPSEPTFMETNKHNNNTTLNHLETISNRESKTNEEKIVETQDAAMRLITLKEQEIARLTTRLKEAEYLLKEKDAQMSDTAKDLSKTQMMQQIEIENIKTQQVKYYEQKLAELARKFHEDTKAMQEAHSRKIEESDIIWKKKLQAVEFNRDALVDTLQNKDIEIEQNWDIKLRGVHSDYRNQIMQLHELLNAESTRLSDAREDINQLSNARKSDLVTLKAKLQTLLNIMEQKEREFTTNTKLLKDQFSSKEEDYKTQMRNLRSTQQIEVDHLQTLVRQMEAKLVAQEQTWRDLEVESKNREATSHEFILSLQKEIHDIRQGSAQRDVEWRFWGQRCHKLETENVIIRNELSLLESEGRRLREVSEIYEGELAHLDNIVYGTTRTKPNNASRQFRVSK